MPQKVPSVINAAVTSGSCSRNGLRILQSHCSSCLRCDRCNLYCLFHKHDNYIYISSSALALEKAVDIAVSPSLINSPKYQLSFHRRLNQALCHYRCNLCWRPTVTAEVMVAGCRSVFNAATRSDPLPLTVCKFAGSLFQLTSLSLLLDLLRTMFRFHH